MAEVDKTIKKAAKKSVKKAAAKPVKKAATKSVSKAVKAPAEKAAVAPASEVAAKPEKQASPAPAGKAAKPSAKNTVKLLSLTLIRSRHGRLASHKACVSGLGLRRMHQTVQVIDTPENRGMINRVHYLLNVEEV